MIKFTLLHPSRWRSAQARKTLDKWLQCSMHPERIEHILSLDSDDHLIGDYNRLFPNSIIHVDQNQNVVQATNNARHLCTGEIVIYLSDDFECPMHWDKLLEQKYLEHGSPDLWLVRVDDCLQKLHADVLTIPIMTKKLMDHLGYFWHPGYASMFVDQDLFYTCKNNGWLFRADDLKFPHLHYCNGMAPNDPTYERSSKNWQQGQQLYVQRKKQNFPL